MTENQIDNGWNEYFYTLDMETQVQEYIQRILDIAQDGAEGYRKLASKMNDSDLATIFNRLSQQRKMFVEEIKYECLVLGEEMKTDGSTAGYFHRMLMDIKAPFSDDEELINMAVRGEQEAVLVYEKCITLELPKYLREKLVNQLNLIKGAINQLQHFESMV